MWLTARTCRDDNTELDDFNWSNCRTRFIITILVEEEKENCYQILKFILNLIKVRRRLTVRCLVFVSPLAGSGSFTVRLAVFSWDSHGSLPSLDTSAASVSHKTSRSAQTKHQLNGNILQWFSPNIFQWFSPNSFQWFFAIRIVGFHEQESIMLHRR